MRNLTLKNKMKMLITIRNCLYVSTRSLAHYLGISYDMLKSVSSGRRDWSPVPLLAAARLFDALDQNTPVEELEYARAFLEQEGSATEKLLEREIKKLENKLVLVREELTELKKSRDNYLRGLHACERLLLTPVGSEKRKWLLLRKKHLELRLKEKGPVAECLLSAKIAGLESTIGHLKKSVT